MRPAKRMPSKSSKIQSRPKKRKASSNGHTGNGHSGANGKGANGKNGAGHAQVRIEFEKFSPVIENPRHFVNPFPQVENADARYQQLVEQLPAITYMAEFGPAGKWEYVSPQIHSLLGFSQNEWMSTKGLWLRQVHPDDRERVMEAEAEGQRNGKRFEAEYRMFTRDGRVAWFHHRAVLVEKGGRILMHGFMLNITEGREAEQALLKLSRQT